MGAPRPVQLKERLIDGDQFAHGACCPLLSATFHLTYPLLGVVYERRFAPPVADLSRSSRAMEPVGYVDL